MPTNEEVRAALRNVLDPEIGKHGGVGVFAVSDGDVLGSKVEPVSDTGRVTINVPVSGSAAGARVLLAYVADSGGTTSTATPVR